MKNNTDKFREDSLAKLEILKKAGVNPYPSKSKRNKKIAVFLDNFNKEENAILAGRIRSIRSHGKIGFADIEDESGKIQIFFQSENLDNFELLLETLIIGDIIEIKGKPYLTKAGQQSIQAENIEILSKSIASWPVEHFGIKDKEERFRKRYLDISLNSEVKKYFIQKTKIIKAIRDYLEKADFTEVSTPVLQTIAGGTMAKPFKTHLDTFDMDLYLRIALELYHTYQDWEWLINFTENMLKNVFEIAEKPLLKDNKWRNIEFSKLIKEKTGLDYEQDSKEDFEKFAEKNNINIAEYFSKGKIADEIFKKLIRIDIKEPTFVTKIQIDISPLSKQLEDESKKTARFLLIINGMELVNGFSELNDPIEQAKRFESQMEMRKKGDKEIQEYDKDFIEALEYGMPPTAGLGLGIDRLVMLLTGASNLREIIEFPLMKRK